MKKLNISLIGLSLFACTSAIFADDCITTEEYKFYCTLNPSIDKKNGGAFTCIEPRTKTYSATYKQAQSFVDAMGYQAVITCKEVNNKLVCKGCGSYETSINQKVKNATGHKWAGWYWDKASNIAILKLEKNNQ